MLRFEQNNALKEPKESSFSTNPKGIKGKSQQKSAGRWTKEEHQRFVDGLTKFGKNWKSIEEYVGTRNGAQVRSHAQKYFNKLGKDGLPSFEGINLQLAKKSEEIIRKTSGSSLDTNDSDQDHEDQGSESPIEEKLKRDLTNSNLVDKLSMSLASSEKPNVWEHAGLVQKKENANDLNVTTFSLFNLLMSKFKSCNNQVIMPRLSDIVQVSTGIENRIPDLYNTSRNSLSAKFSFRLHQSNITGNNQTPARNLDRLRTSHCDDSSEQDLLVKKLKVN